MGSAGRSEHMLFANALKNSMSCTFPEGVLEGKPASFTFYLALHLSQ